MVQLWGEIQSGTENINESEKERRKRDRQRKTQADRHTGRDTNYVFTRLSSGLRNTSFFFTSQYAGGTAHRFKYTC